MKLTNGCAIFGDKNGPQGSGTYFSINKVMASLRAPSYANLVSMSGQTEQSNLVIANCDAQLENLQML